MTQFIRYALPLCALLTFSAAVDITPTLGGVAHASDYQESQEKRDDPSYKVRTVKEVNGQWRALVQNDHGFGNYATGSSKKEARQNGEGLAAEYNGGDTEDCVDICTFNPELCDMFL